MTATEKAGSSSDMTSDGWGSVNSGSDRAIAEMSPTTGTPPKLAAVGMNGRFSTTSSTVAATIAMMKAKRCNRFRNSSATIIASVTPPMMLTGTSIWPMRNNRSKAWATRFENALGSPSGRATGQG